MNKVFVSLVLFFSLLFLSACGTSPETLLAGSWRSVDNAADTGKPLLLFFAKEELIDGAGNKHKIHYKTSNGRIQILDEESQKELYSISSVGKDEYLVEDVALARSAKFVRASEEEYKKIVDWNYQLVLGYWQGSEEDALGRREILHLAPQSLTDSAGIHFSVRYEYDNGDILVINQDASSSPAKLHNSSASVKNSRLHSGTNSSTSSGASSSTSSGTNSSTSSGTNSSTNSGVNSIAGQSIPSGNNATALPAFQEASSLETKAANATDLAAMNATGLANANATNITAANATGLAEANATNTVAANATSLANVDTSGVAATNATHTANATQNASRLDGGSAVLLRISDFSKSSIQVEVLGIAKSFSSISEEEYKRIRLLPPTNLAGYWRSYDSLRPLSRPYYLFFGEQGLENVFGEVEEVVYSLDNALLQVSKRENAELLYGIRNITSTSFTSTSPTLASLNFLRSNAEEFSAAQKSASERLDGYWMSQHHEEGKKSFLVALNIKEASFHSNVYGKQEVRFVQYANNNSGRIDLINKADNKTVLHITDVGQNYLSLFGEPFLSGRYVEITQDAFLGLMDLSVENVQGFWKSKEINPLTGVSFIVRVQGDEAEINGKKYSGVHSQYAGDSLEFFDADNKLLFKAKNLLHEEVWLENLYGHGSQFVRISEQEFASESKAKNSPSPSYWKRVDAAQVHPRQRDLIAFLPNAILEGDGRTRTVNYVTNLTQIDVLGAGKVLQLSIIGGAGDTILIEKARHLVDSYVRISKNEFDRLLKK